MPTAQRDTEITLGTGRMLALFFTFVIVCAIFFTIGFSLGRKTTYVTAGNPVNSPSEPSSAVRPSAAKQNPPQSAAQSTEFSFYKSVGAKNTDSDLVASAVQTTNSPADAQKTPTPVSTNPATSGAGYYVQVAAVSRQEDAESLVEALKKKQYPAFTASSSSADKFFHVQVGPYSDLKEAENMRARLIANGYNPIVKK
jgi:cell division septation protein DedD